MLDRTNRNDTFWDVEAYVPREDDVLDDEHFEVVGRIVVVAECIALVIVGLIVAGSIVGDVTRLIK